MRIVTDAVFYTRLTLITAIIALGGAAYFLLFFGAGQTPPLPLLIPVSPPSQEYATSSTPTHPQLAPPAQKQKKCVATGCNGEICADAADPPRVSLCLYKDEYACYKTAACAVQADGACGWTQTAQLKMCVSAARCGAPPDQPSPPAGCRYESTSSCTNGQWTLPRLVCGAP